MSFPFLSHVDVRVRDRARATAFYERIFALLGAGRNTGEKWTTWGRKVERGLSGGGDSYNWFGFTEDATMMPGSTRVAFYAPDRPTVDAVAAILVEIGATSIEWTDGEYGPDYYAVFFADPDGNLIEVCAYESGEG